MIDLHTHTKYSDGTDSLIELLCKAESKKINVISITDHNTVKAYEELKTLDIKKYFKGKIIPGIELNTKILGVPIEILGYGIDFEKMNNTLKDIYISPEKRNKIEVQRLYEKCKKSGIKIDEVSVKNFDGSYFASAFIQSEIKKYPENEKFVSKEALADTRIFYREYMSNPEGILYVEMDDIVPDFDTAASAIRKSGGLVFIPHIFEYRENSEKILKYILEKCEIDGIECFYTTFSEEQKMYLKDICENKKLYMSGGSDYHGANKPKVDLGCGFGNLIVEDEIIKEWIEKLSVIID